MNKIIALLFFNLFLLGSSLNAANLYLVDNGNTTGTNLMWESQIPSGFTNIYKVNLSSCNGGSSASLTQWLTDRNKTTAPSYTVSQVVGSSGNVTFTTSDQVWITAGTYSVSTTWTILSGSGAVVPAGIYGGFAGNETTLSGRIKGAIGNPWDYSNETIVDGGMTCSTGFTTAISARTILYDGLTLNGFITTVAIYLRDGGTVQNCKFTNNGNGTYAGGGSVSTYGSAATTTTVSGCYFYNNVSSTKCPGLNVNANTGTGTYNISNCWFENNNSSRAGADGSALFVSRATGTATVTVSNCIFKNNTASYYRGGTIVLNNEYASIKNCLIYGTTTTPALFFNTNGGSIYNCTFVNNTGGGARSLCGSAAKLYNTVFWGTDGTGVTGSGAVITETTAETVLTNCALVASTTGSFAPTLTGCVTLPRTNTGVNAPYFIDPTSNNWQLGVGSSLINSGIDHATIAGVPVFDLLNVTRSQGAGYDIGAYEPITTSANSSTLSLTATSNVSILNGGILTIDANTTASALTVNSGGQLTLNNGFTLNASLLTIQADTAKSGSFVDFNTTGGLTVSGTSSVQQWLSTGRNWYVSSPVSNASSAVVNAAGGLNKLYWYDEAHSSTNPWPQISTNDITLQAMKGYIFNMAADGNVTFTGNFNTGSKSITVSRTTGEIKEGFNLIGNPYPSYVNWDLATKTNISSTIWYRTKAKSGSYTFDTYNAISHVGTNTNGVRAVTGLIPPMQTVWVRVDAGQSSGSVAFNNNMRSHKTELATALKAKSLNNEIQQSVRLSVSNGINNDETILVFNPAASNDLDGFDSEKMSNNNSSFPEIFTSTNSKNLTINGLKTIPYDTEIPIGFTTLSAGNFKIIASDVKNISQETLLVLKDNYTGAQTNLSTGVYEFSSDATTNNLNRFSIIFKMSGVTTEINSSRIDLNISLINRGLLSINGDDYEGSKIEIYDLSGKILYADIISQSFVKFKRDLLPGIYIVKIINNGQVRVQKIKIN